MLAPPALLLGLALGACLVACAARISRGGGRKARIV